MIRSLAAASATALLFSTVALFCAAPLAAQPKADPDWPCPQRKTPEIDLAQVWNGPDPASAGKWTDDQDAAALAVKLSSRRTPAKEFAPLLDGFVKEAGAEADKGLLRVMAGVYEIINDQRGKLMHGIERYARGQQRLADRIRDEADELSKVRSSITAPETPESRKLDEQLHWDTRIFDERAKSLTYVCETPVLLEQRAFDIGQQIQARLKVKG
ncbi:hypothetical protein [Xanthobacter flavus]|uniref:hypothetical protein n=1 Tax=Xanthobacter flavus TaxID=281 RepID=UPI001DDF5E8C|nr:hypothetical protein [Xanthobacter flavus]